jgi:3-methyladenine DNA glycosylase/8-oxoguanine DNA glycosylase
MPRFTLPTPRDYTLRRDVCSYGYFLLSPNRWDVGRRVIGRVLSLGDRPVYAEISQNGPRGTPLTVITSRSLGKPARRQAEAQLTRMLRLDEDTPLIRAFHKVDPRFKRAGRGRLFRSASLFEDVIKTVTSCNVTWPNTVQMNVRLCEALGDRVEFRGVMHYGFPRAEKVARTRPQVLRARCRVGYRDARIVELARLFTLPVSRGGIDEAWLTSPQTADDDVFRALVDLPGIGPYAAANIMQLMGRYGRLPLDTESVRHGRTLLGFAGTPAQVMKKVHSHFAPFGAHAFRSYWFELWDFYESKHGRAWTWERDSTGKLFTAALLNK